MLVGLYEYRHVRLEAYVGDLGLFFGLGFSRE